MKRSSNTFLTLIVAATGLAWLSPTLANTPPSTTTKAQSQSVISENTRKELGIASGATAGAATVGIAGKALYDAKYGARNKLLKEIPDDIPKDSEGERYVNFKDDYESDNDSELDDEPYYTRDILDPESSAYYTQNKDIEFRKAVLPDEDSDVSDDEIDADNTSEDSFVSEPINAPIKTLESEINAEKSIESNIKTSETNTAEAQSVTKATTQTQQEIDNQTQNTQYNADTDEDDADF